MKKISFWASTHVNTARFFLVCIKITLAVMACFLGILLTDTGIILPGKSIYLYSFLFLVVILVFYPSKTNRFFSKNQNYAVRKSFDCLLGACSFLVIASMANNSDTVISPVLKSYGSSVIGKRPPSAEEILTALKNGEKKTLTRKEKRVLKKEWMRQLKIYAVAKVSGNKDGASNALLIILTIIAACGLIYLLAGLACTLSCNGSDAAAIIVALLGLTAIIWGTIALIKRIKRGPKNKGPAKTE